MSPSSLERPLFVVAAGLLVVLNACKKPEIKVETVRPAAASPEYLTVMVELSVTNRLDMSVKIRRVDGILTLGGRYELPPFSAEPEVWLDPAVSKRVEIPIRVRWSDVPGVAQDAVTKGRVTWRARGRVSCLASKTFASSEVEPFDESGSITHAELVKAATKPAPLPLPIPLPVPNLWPLPTPWVPFK